jgi:hypothetical protein
MITPNPELKSELSAKLVPTVEDRGRCEVSAMDTAVFSAFKTDFLLLRKKIKLKKSRFEFLFLLLPTEIKVLIQPHFIQSGCVHQHSLQRSERM